MNIIKTYKHNKKTVCYIKENNNIYSVCTGNPSDVSCLSWKYNDLNEAIKTANEYFENYTK